MRYMLLMRHANALFPEPGMTDFERPLSELGRREAASTATQILQSGLTPNRVICSPARRAAETLESVRMVMDIAPELITKMAELYSGDPGTYVDVICNNTEADSITLLIGHNPMLEDCALEMADTGTENEIAALRRGFPTGAVAVFRLTGMNGSTKGHLERFITA